jgi:UDP-glucose 4-epimerase
VNIVIIGCNGFIGSNFLNYYSSIGADILCVGRIKPKSFQHKFLELDDFLSLDKKLEYDIWINAAGSGDVQLSLTKPEIDYNANVELVRLLLELKLKISPTGIFVHFSSAAVYGNPIKLPIAENDELNPITPWSKNNCFQAFFYFRNWTDQTNLMGCFSKV